MAFDPVLENSDEAIGVATPLAGRASPRWLADQVVEALVAELDLTPKPGLVDRRGAGVHRDMDYRLMQASIAALRPGFIAIAEAGAATDSPADRRARLGLLGREAEAAMLLATGGINTHRGAIWCLGLLTAAAARLPIASWQAQRLVDAAAQIAAINDPAVDAARVSNGRRAVSRYGVAGAQGIAIQGLIPVVRHGLPALRRARAAGENDTAAQGNALIAIMAMLDDTCVLHRGGAAALAAMHAGSSAVQAAGGWSQPAGQSALVELEAALVAYRASPGGAADLLAATLFIDRLETEALRTRPRYRTGENAHANAVV